MHELRKRLSDTCFVIPRYALPVAQREGVPAVGIGVLPFGRMAGHSALDLWSPGSLSRMLQDVQPDVVHVMGEASYSITWLIARMIREQKKARRITFSCRAAQNVPQTWPVPFRQLERQAMQELDIIFAVSRDAEEVARMKGYQGTIINLPNGYDDKVFNTSQHRQHGGIIRLGYVGKFTERKGLKILLQALGEIREEPWHLSLVGKGPLEPYIRHRLQEDGLSHKVTILPYMPRQDLARVYSELDVLILPSITSDGSDHGLGRYFKFLRVQWREQFGRVLVEAMACGLPIIGSNCGAIPEVVGDAGWIVPEAEPTSLAEVIRRLMREPHQLSARAALARQRAERFKWKTIAGRMVEVWGSYRS